MSFWDIVWFIFITYVFFAYLMVLFSIIADIFRDRETGGFAKAIWILALIVLPFLSVIVYLITRGSSMHERADRQAEAYQAQQESYIKTVAGTSSPIDDVSKAKALLDSGAITQAEFDSIKAKALS
jgi:uncharacterized membrane protein YcjF (UPF0283 family)